jgi:hypothetical protein
VRFTNTSDETQELPTLGVVVAPGEEFEATGDDAKNLQASPFFKRTDKPRTTTDSEEK